MKTLKDLREEIDNIDSQILELLNKRAVCVIKVGEIKKKEGSPVWVNSREEQIYARLKEENQGPFPQHSLRNVFREIMSASLCLEEEVRVAFLGPVGTFSNLAAVKRFGQSAKLIPVRNIGEIFQGVEKGHVHYGIVPVENSLEGAVNQSLDMFMDSDVIIMGEVYVEIAENLLNKTGRKEDIKKIYSHPSPLGQCSKWLAKNFPDTELIPCESTALAAEMAQNDETVAAIGSELAEAVYNLKVKKTVKNISQNMRKRKLRESSLVTHFEDMLGDVGTEDSKEFELFEQCRGILTDEEYDLLISIYVKGIPPVRKAEELNVSIWTYYKRVKKMIDKLRRELENEK